MGVVGFDGARLAEARSGRGISSRKALADLMKRAPSTIIRWEEGETTPEPAALSELAAVLAVPEDFFLTPRVSGGGQAFFRSYFTGTLKSERQVQQVRLLWLEDIAAVANHYAHLPEVDVPDLSAGRHFRTFSEDDFEDLAQQAREHWNLGGRPIPDMLAFLERIGVIVASEAMEADGLDALSRWGADGRPYVLLANDKQSFARRQFDCAHELAHLLLHRAVTPKEFGEHHKLIEDQAHRFASAFLLPASQFAAEISSPNLWDLERLKLRWKVSIKAQIVRLQRLEILDKSAASRLYKIYSAKGFSRCEPYDRDWPLQEPSTLGDVFRALIESGHLTKPELRGDLPLLPHDVESLASLPEGWLTLEPARVITLRTEPKQSYSRIGSGEVVSLNKREP